MIDRVKVPNSPDQTPLNRRRKAAIGILAAVGLSGISYASHQASEANKPHVSAGHVMYEPAASGAITVDIGVMPGDNPESVAREYAYDRQHQIAIKNVLIGDEVDGQLQPGSDGIPAEDIQQQPDPAETMRPKPIAH